MADTGELKKLQYKIHKCSGYLSNYVPENILVDNPSDQSSRWSTNTNTPPQFLTLRLERPAIVKTITFGKYNKTHVCNLKKFAVAGGMQDGTFVELLNAGLENNSIQETFPLRHSARGGRPFPVQYISVVPLMAWGPSFNYCVWYLELRGQDDPTTVRSALYSHNLHAEEETIRVCLKHFRQQRYVGAYAALQRETGVVLEAPQLSTLYHLLVEVGDFEGAERLLKEAGSEGLFNWYAAQQPYTATWSVVSPCSPELAERLAGSDSPPRSPPHSPPRSPSPHRALSPLGVPARPGWRGGHQMCAHPGHNTLYLFGGWDGENDLSDLWSYYVPEDRWTLICKRSEQMGGPSPRSCHKMVLDSGRRQIFILGRYLDIKHRTPDSAKCDLYMWDLEAARWWLVCEDTAARGGPRLLFDHQMCVDSERHIIYVFGGKVLPPMGQSEDASPQYSGLYSYHIAEDRWHLLLADSSTSGVPGSILSRVSHSMLFHPVTRTLYVFGGQRNKEHLVDLLAVGVGAGTPRVRALCTAAPPRRAPPPGFTQRATIDPNLNEIYVLSGLSKEKDKRVSNSMWVFSLARLQWSCVYRNDNNAQHYWAKMHAVEPCPRFAHQLVYDPESRTHFLFGGNPGRSAQPSLRLDDFWALKLTRLSSKAAWRQARLMLRRLKFEELAAAGEAGGRAALAYLQTRLHHATDHSDSQQARQFQLLATMLFSEKRELMTFNPPIEASLTTVAPPLRWPRPDPELHEDFGCTSDDDGLDKNDAYSRQYSPHRCTDAEQQALFAAVLGMEGDCADDGEMACGSASPERPAVLPVGPIVGQDKWDALERHYRRCQLFQQLSDYFPQHMVQPKKNLTDYMTF